MYKPMILGQRICKHVLIGRNTHLIFCDQVVCGRDKIAEISLLENWK